MKLKEKVSIEQIEGTTFKIRLVELQRDRKALVTHFLHNYENGVSKHYNKYANKYLKEYITSSLPTEEYNLVSENALQQLLFEVENVPFPSPKDYKFKFIDLFAGIGGIRLAAQNSGGKCVFSSEWDEFAQETYMLNFGEFPFGDITKKETKKFIPAGFDMLFAGFPCQPFSYAGLNLGFEDKVRGTLFFDIIEILRTHKPKMFLLENVKGLKSHDGGKTLKTIEESLISLGYNIKWKILNSYDFGLPQYRERWYCVGSLQKIDFEFPNSKLRGSKLKSIIDIKCNNDPKLALSVSEIERIKFHFESLDQRVQHDNSKYEVNTKKGKHGVYSYQKPDGALRFHIGDAAKTQIQEAFYACQETYAPTIIANRVPKLWDLKRKLSVLEAQRLQGYPDTFKFNVSDNQAYKQLGNSVAVPVLQAIISQMIKYI